MLLELNLLNGLNMDNLSFEEAERVGLVAQEGCMGGCMKERRKLYRITDGTYAGFIYCKECMKNYLKRHDERVKVYRKMLERGEEI